MAPAGGRVCGGLWPFARAVGGRGERARGGWRFRQMAERRQAAGGRAFFCPDISSPAASAVLEGARPQNGVYMRMGGGKIACRPQMGPFLRMEIRWSSRRMTT